MVDMEIEKRRYFSYSNSCKEDKIFHHKNEMTTLVLDEKKCCNPNKVHFGKKCPKFSKILAIHS